MRLVKPYFIIVFLFFAISCSKEDFNYNQSEESTTVNITQNRQAVGSSANDILSDSYYDEMIIELVYAEGLEPREETINNMVNFLQNRIYKPNGISIEKRSIPSSGKSAYTLQDIAEIEINERQYYNTSNTIAIWALFIDGESATNSNDNTVLGSAYWNTSFVIFEETVQEFSDSTFEPNRTLLETTVISHELGHLFGLTNLGTEMVNDHEDNQHPKHCNNNDCLMYWATESSAGLGNMLNMSSPPGLDSQCIADLQANGGK